MNADEEPLARLREVSSALETSDDLADPALFQQIIDVLPDALLIADSHARVCMVNQQLELLFGYPRSLLLGEPFAVLIPPELRERHAKHFENYFDNPTVRPMKAAQALSGVRRDGKLVSVQIILGPLVSKRGTLGLALIRRMVNATSQE